MSVSSGDEKARDHVLVNWELLKKAREFSLPTFKKYWTVPVNVRDALRKDPVYRQLSPKVGWI